MSLKYIEIDLPKDDWRSQHMVGSLAIFLRHIILVLPTLIIALNSMTAVAQITETLRSNIHTPAKSDKYYIMDSASDSNTFYNNYQPSFWTCENPDGYIISITWVCEYSNHPAFIGVMSVWLIWAVVMMGCTYFYSINYSANDLRFFVSAEGFQSTNINKVLVGFGTFLTLATFFTGIYYATAEGNGGNSNFWFSLIIFFCVNLSSLNELFRRDFNINMDEWKEEIPVIPVLDENRSIMNLYGGLVTSNGVFQKLESVLVAQYLGTGDEADRNFALYGDEKQLKNAMRLLGPRVTKVTGGIEDI